MMLLMPLGVSVLLLVLLLAAGCTRQATDAPAELDLATLLGGDAPGGFARVTAPRAFVFPDDHGAHPQYRNEWWYVTGNVSTAQGREFGYQVTLFRVSLSPQSVERESGWASNQVWMAHVALTDVMAERHYHGQRFARGALGLAGQQQEPFKVWLEDWQIVGQGAGALPWTIEVATDEFHLAMQIAADKPVVLQGDQGLSQKSAEVGNASYYYSFTRLRTVGEITLGGKKQDVSGWSWLDREWSTSALGADQAGWDWFSLQLDDGLHAGSDVMFYRMRTKSGTTDSHSQGVWVNQAGAAETLAHIAVKLQPLRWWRSAATGIRYPVAWRMTIPTRQQSWLIEAAVDAQEMVTGIRYWEGTVRVIEEQSGKTLGKGYLEMTGYQLQLQ